MSNFLEKLHAPVHQSWKDFLTEDIVDELQKIENSMVLVSQEFTPPVSRVLHFMTNNLDDAKVVIIGQDPYPQAGVATGRAFEVGTLNSWNATFRNVSLKNIIRSVYSAYEGEYLTYSLIKEKMKGNLFEPTFSLMPPDRLFKSWEKQGVLLLNTSFTCEIGNPGSHSKLWNNFTTALLSYVKGRNPDIIWFLWGNHAKDITSHLDMRNMFASNHPMICKEGERDFLFGEVNMFAETKNLINWKGEFSVISQKNRNSKR
jgi:uracil-DNA glycosylase